MSFKFNPITGKLDLVGSPAQASPDNFSYKLIEVGESKTVPVNQQMLFDGNILVQGNLMVLGEIKEITKTDDEGFFYTTILLSENVKVRENRLLLYKDNIMVLGNLNVLGTLAEAS